MQKIENVMCKYLNVLRNENVNVLRNENADVDRFMYEKSKPL